jgi:hypothetical protein
MNIKCHDPVGVKILRAYQYAAYVSPCLTSEGDPSPRPVGGFPVTANWVKQVNAN